MAQTRSTDAHRSLIFLTGFMGSGKSTIGPILANTLGFEFADIDKLIERRAEKRIVEIFATEGEQRFRQIERAVLEQVAGLNHMVVSLGGGTIANEENFSFIRKHGIIVYLQLSPEEIVQRVRHRSDRPMLKDDEGEMLPPGVLEERITELLSHREPFYARADVIVPADKKRLGITVDEIVRRIRPLL